MHFVDSELQDQKANPAKRVKSRHSRMQTHML